VKGGDLMLHKPQRYDSGTFLMYVNSYENGILEGQFHHPHSEESGRFLSLTQLLCGITRTLDVENVPQSFLRVRTFQTSDSAPVSHSCEPLPISGETATFILQIMFRKNASWQGFITRLEDGHKQHFRSVLELIAIINGSITSAETCLLLSDDATLPEAN